MKRIYLACPFAHKDPKVKASRVELADVKAAELMEKGYRVFSPLSHSYPISKHCGVPEDAHGFWLRQDLWILEICDEFHILCLPGWENSKGIAIEQKRAEQLKMTVVLHGA